MNINFWTKRLPEIQAFCEKKPTQVSLLGTEKWVDLIDPHPQFENPSYAFRVKPEPRRFYLHEKDIHLFALQFDGSIEVIEVLK